MNSALTDKISRALTNLEFINRIQEKINISLLFQERMKGKMPLLAEMYEKTEDEIYIILMRAIPKSMDVQGLGEGKQLYERYEEECLDGLICTAMITI